MPAADPNRDFVVALALSKIHRLAVADDPKLEDVRDALPPLRLLLIDGNLKLCATSHGVNLRVPPANTSYLDAYRPMSAVRLGVGGDCRLWGSDMWEEFAPSKDTLHPSKARQTLIDTARWTDF